jgi:hypothetical protein
MVLTEDERRLRRNAIGVAWNKKNRAKKREQGMVLRKILGKDGKTHWIFAERRKK